MTKKSDLKNIITKAKEEERDLTDEEFRNIKSLIAELRAGGDASGETEDDKSEDKPSGDTESEQANNVDEKKEEDSEAPSGDTTESKDEEKPSGETEEKSCEVEPKKEEAPKEERSASKKKVKNNIIVKETKNRMEKRFSLVRSIRAIANNQKLDELDSEVVRMGAEEMRNAGLSAQGQIQLPSAEKRAGITVATEGEDVVATDIFDLLTPLRAKNVLVQAGARFYGGLQGNIQVPVMTKSNVGWADEIEEAKDGAGSFSHITLSPKRLTAFIDISKQMLVQDSVDVENALRNDLVAAINSKLEETLLSEAAATQTSPAGMFNSISATAITDFAGVVANEALIDDANVLGEPVYVMSNKMKAALRTMSKGKANGDGLVFADGTVDGARAYATSNVAGKKYIYGDFSNLAIANWGNVDLVVDPYSLAKNGEIRIVVNTFVDGAILRPEAFVAGQIK